MSASQVAGHKNEGGSSRVSGVQVCRPFGVANTHAEVRVSLPHRLQRFKIIFDMCRMLQDPNASREKSFGGGGRRYEIILWSALFSSLQRTA